MLLLFHQRHRRRPTGVPVVGQPEDSSSRGLSATDDAVIIRF